jgi:hypothetical protein
MYVYPGRIRSYGPNATKRRRYHCRVISCVCEKVTQNVGSPSFCENYYVTLTTDKSSPIICATSPILTKTTQSKKSPNGRKFAARSRRASVWSFFCSCSSFFVSSESSSPSGWPDSTNFRLLSEYLLHVPSCFENYRRSPKFGYFFIGKSYVLGFGVWSVTKNNCSLWEKLPCDWEVRVQGDAGHPG